MTKLTNAALFFLAAGIFTSVSILSGYQVLIAIPLIYFTYVAIKENNWQLPKSAWFLLAFAAVAVISLVINIEHVPKPSKNFGRVKYFLFGVGGIYVYRYWLKEASDKTKKILVNTFLLSIAVAGIYAVYYKFTHPLDRVRGLTDTMRYGYGSGMVLLTLLSAMIHHRKISNWFNWKIALPVFIIGFIGMYITYTRGALLGFLCGLPFVLFFFKPKIGIAVGVLAGICGLVLGYFYFFGNIKQGEGSRFLMTSKNHGDVIRRSQWKAAVIAVKEKPALGWGLSNFHSQLKRIKTEYDLDAKEYDNAHAHNLFLEVAAGTGVVGLLLFLGWLIAWALEALKGLDLVSYLVVPFGVAFVVSSQFEVTFDANNASMIFFVYALSSAVKGRYVQ